MAELSPKDVAILRAVVADYKRKPTKNKPAQARPWTLQGGGVQDMKIGVVKDDPGIEPLSSGTIMIYRDGIYTGEDVIAWLDWMAGDTRVSMGRQVFIGLFADETPAPHWRILGSECEDIPPDVGQAGNADEPQTLTAVFTQIEGMTVTYESGDGSQTAPPP